MRRKAGECASSALDTRACPPNDSDRPSRSPTATTDYGASAPGPSSLQNNVYGIYRNTYEYTEGITSVDLDIGAWTGKLCQKSSQFLADGADQAVVRRILQLIEERSGAAPVTKP